MVCYSIEKTDSLYTKLTKRVPTVTLEALQKNPQESIVNCKVYLKVNV